MSSTFARYLAYGASGLCEARWVPIDCPLPAALPAAKSAGVLKQQADLSAPCPRSAAVACSHRPVLVDTRSPYYRTTTIPSSLSLSFCFLLCLSFSVFLLLPLSLFRCVPPARPLHTRHFGRSSHGCTTIGDVLLVFGGEVCQITHPPARTCTHVHVRAHP